MPALEISIDCLCLFVPDPGASTVHVLMPPTHVGHRHVVRLIYANSPDVGCPMEGWLLRLGLGDASATASLQPQVSSGKGERIVDLTPIAGHVDRGLVAEPEPGGGGSAPADANGESGEGHGNSHVAHPHPLAARIELRKGGIFQVSSHATWEFNNQDVPLSFRVEWIIPEIADHELQWVPLWDHGRSPPFTSLAEFEDLSGHRRLHVYHVTEDALPPSAVGQLDPDQVLEHFRAFYALYGFQPQPAHLPRRPRPFGGSSAMLTHLATAARRGNDRAAVAHLATISEAMLSAAREGFLDPDLERRLFFSGKLWDCPNGGGTFAPAE